MLPNDFPNRGGAPGYNTVDAALWYVEAVRAYVESTGDESALDEFWPTLLSIVDWYERGTRFGIGVDPADGLLRAGEAGVQVTWMDARVGDRVVTPRIGKPVEVNALWYNALRAMAVFADRGSTDGARFERLAARVRTGFARYTSVQNGGLFDVIDGPEGDDAGIRPNQIFAVALHFSPLDAERQRAVVDLCARELLTSNGLRSLSPRDPRYVGRYTGPPAQRDAAYHQGTVWPWLLGPFAIAHARANDDRSGALAFLEPLLDRVLSGGLGTLNEIADGDAPFTPRGCISQAWSVAEVLRAWHALQR
jgi:predicted glycogen debranching enzyme